MATYVARRLLQLVPVFFVMSAIVFFLVHILPGDATMLMLPEDATAEQRALMRAELGLDRPAIVQYGDWLLSAVQGDFGHSLRTREPIHQMVADRLPVTLELTILGLIFGLVIGVPLGIAAASRRNTLVDHVTSSTSLFGLAMPNFWLGVLLVLLLSVTLGWLPPSGYVPFFEDPARHVKLFVMPTITVGMSMLALVVRQTRGSLLEVMSEDFLRTARAKGLTERTVLYKHALRNALLPVVTVVGLQVGALIGGAVITETIFRLPGIGLMIVDAIYTRDFPVVQGSILLVVSAVLVINLLTDLAYAQLDPRIKLAA